MLCFLVHILPKQRRAASRRVPPFSWGQKHKGHRIAIATPHVVLTKQKGWRWAFDLFSGRQHKRTRGEPPVVYGLLLL